MCCPPITRQMFLGPRHCDERDLEKLPRVLLHRAPPEDQPASAMASAK